MIWYGEDVRVMRIWWWYDTVKMLGWWDLRMIWYGDDVRVLRIWGWFACTTRRRSSWTNVLQRTHSHIVWRYPLRTKRPICRWKLPICQSMSDRKTSGVGATLPVPLILLMQLRQCEWKNPKRPKAKYQRMTFHISRYVVNDLKIHLSHGIPQRR